MLKQHGACEVEGKASAGASTGRAAYAATEISGQTAILFVEEQLAVGKREVDRGGVRVYSHVVETPVTADVTMRDEQILVERRPVDRMATAADFNMGQGSVIEINAIGEEAVVGKTARVVEEVLLGKTSTSHTEVIHDSVRKPRWQSSRLSVLQQRIRTATSSEANTPVGRHLRADLALFVEYYDYQRAAADQHVIHRGKP